MQRFSLVLITNSLALIPGWGELRPGGGTT